MPAPTRNRCGAEVGEPEHDDLLAHAADVWSSTGNDGIIAEIFRRLGRSTGTFVEFGAWDGVHLSNCG